MIEISGGRGSGRTSTLLAIARADAFGQKAIAVVAPTEERASKLFTALRRSVPSTTWIEHAAFGIAGRLADFTGPVYVDDLDTPRPTSRQMLAIRGLAHLAVRAVVRDADFSPILDRILHGELTTRDELASEAAAYARLRLDGVR